MEEWKGNRFARDFSEGPELIPIAKVSVMAETEKAILVEYEGDEIWIPKSLVGPNSEVEEPGDEGMIEIPEWFADEKGMI